MKKRLLLAVLAGAAGYSAMAQSPVRLNPEHQGTDPASFVSLVSHQSQGKQVVTEWYNFVESSDVDNGGSIAYTLYNNNFLFPDSTVKQRYGVTGGGTRLSGVNRHNVGQMFDPSSFYYANILSKHNPYTVDSINFAYRYANVIPGTVDTLLFQVYFDNAILKGELAGGTPPDLTAWIKYNRTEGKGAGAKQEWKIPISIEDTSWANWNVMALKLPSIASIARGGLFAVSYSFIPGYDYSTGDTLDQSWDAPAPTKLLNQFQPYIARDLTKTAEDSYNHGLAANSATKYDPNNNWKDNFIPGDAWIDFTEYVYIGVHISSPNVGINPIEGNALHVYPNPSMGSASVNIAFTTTENTNVAIEVYDLLGNKVQTVMNSTVEAGQQVATVNAAALTSGVYIYSVKAGDQVFTGKLSIVK